MTSPQWPELLYGAEQARQLDRVVIDSFDIAALTLMNRAGAAAFDCLRTRWADAQRITIVCGCGNNAGDGYVLARLLREHDYAVRVIQIGTNDGLRPEALTAYQAMLETGLQPESSLRALDDADLIVDALFGVGLNREVTGDLAEAVRVINQLPYPTLSLDVPSGLNASTGQVMGEAVVADTTISFMTAKLGLYTGNGPDYAGQIYVDDLGAPAAAYKQVMPTARTLAYELVSDLLGPRKRAGHKGNHGHALILGGAAGYRGALLLAGEACARSGAGLVSLIGYRDGPELLHAERPELMFRGIDRVEEMDDLLKRADVVAIGPGLGLNEAAAKRFARVLETQLPLVVDADALRLLAAEGMKRDNWVLTPHPGEAASLLGTTVAEVQSDRIAAAKEISKEYGGAVILKGAGSIVVAGPEPEVLMHGNPGMGSGGMGDVLTGVIAGLIAQGLNIANSAQLGACVHARAGDLAALDGERGLLARDLMPHIRRLVN